MVLIFKKEFPCITSSFCFGIIAGTLLIPIFYYAYTHILGKNIFLLDIGIFLLSIVIAFWLSYKLLLSCRLKHYTNLLVGLIGILFACFIIFTYRPPDFIIFENPSLAK